MTIALFITLLTLFASVTGFCTEGVKKMLDESKVIYSSNIVACIIGCIVGIGGTAAYYVLTNINFTSANIVCMLIMGIAVSFGAMVGYDKVIQTVSQIKTKQ